ncbi:unnamed protein product [Lampetra planeri]
MPLAGDKRKSCSNTDGGDDPGSLPSTKLPCLSHGEGPASDDHVASAMVPTETANINDLPSSILLKVGTAVGNGRE